MMMMLVGLNLYTCCNTFSICINENGALAEEPGQWSTNDCNWGDEKDQFFSAKSREQSLL